MKSLKILAWIVAALLLVAPSLCGEEIPKKGAPPTTLFRKDFLEVKVYGLIVDPASLQPVVLLADPAGALAMPIWIGPNEALAIQAELEGTGTPRPLTHDLLGRVIRQFNGTVRRVIITEEKEGIYYAIIVLEKDRTPIEMDARPSDSIAIALKFKVPIFISRSLFKEKAVLQVEQKNVEESYGLTIQELTPPLAESFSFREGKGVLIADVKRGSRAEKGGIQRGDILVKIGAQEIEDGSIMRRFLAEMTGPAIIKLFRGGASSR